MQTFLLLSILFLTSVWLVVCVGVYDEAHLGGFAKRPKQLCSN